MTIHVGDRVKVLSKSVIKEGVVTCINTTHPNAPEAYVWADESKARWFSFTELKHLEPTVFLRGQRVRMREKPNAKGTVESVDRDRVTVVWDSNPGIFAWRSSVLLSAALAHDEQEDRPADPSRIDCNVASHEKMAEEIRALKKEVDLLKVENSDLHRALSRKGR